MLLRNQYILCLFFVMVLIFSQGQIAHAQAPGPCRQAVKLVQRVQDAGPGLGKASIEELYQEALKLCPKMAEIHYNYALFLMDAGDHEQAREEFLSAKEKEDRIEYRLGVARTFLAEAQYSEAKKWYSEVLERDRLNPSALQGLAVVAERSGDIEEASSLLSKALSINSEDPIAHYNLGVLFEKRSMNEEALVQYEKAIQVDSSHFASLLHSGLLYTKAKQYSKAVVVLERGAEIQPSDPRVFRALGVAYERVGQLEKSELQFKRALALEPNDLISRANLGLVLVRLEKPAQVVELFEGSQLDASSAQPIEAFLALALAQVELGRFNDAEQTLRQAYRKAPKDERVVQAMVNMFVAAGDQEQADKFQQLLDSLAP